MPDPFVSVFIPCYNEQDTIAALLDALRAQTYPLNRMEVVIADGMSDDGTRDVLAAYAADHDDLTLRVVDNPRRIIPAALNCAIRAARGEVLIRMDAHSMPAEDYVAACVEVLEATGAANVGGRWKIQPSRPTWIGRSIAVAAAHPLGAGGARYRISGDAGAVETVPFGAYPRIWLDRVGLYDETLLTNEDYELNERIRQAGGLIWFDPAIETVYYARSTFGALWKQYARYGFWKVKMLARYPHSLKWRQAIPPAFVLSAAALALTGGFIPAARLLLGLQLGIYFLALGTAGLREAVRYKDLALVPGFILAIATMHTAWGGAFLVSAVDNLLGGRVGSK